MPTTSIGIIGMGFMGQTHLAAFRAAQAAGSPCTIAAVADADEKRRTGNSTAVGNMVTTGPDQPNPLHGVRGYATAQELLADPAIDAVVICTPTDSHGPLAHAALAAGKHVLVEKPVALEVTTIQELEKAAAAAKRLCMPGMCIRFWPAWVWLKNAVASRRYGNVLSASFTRIGSRPSWSPEFYLNPARSGGAMFDLHVHDVDFIFWLFGKPASVFSAGDHFGVTTLYEYSSVPGQPFPPRRITATGAWLTSPGFPFRMQYLVEFEHAIADFDLTRTPQVRLIKDGTVEDVVLPPGAGYEPQAVEFLRALANTAQPPTTLRDAADVVAIIRAEIASQETRRNVALK